MTIMAFAHQRAGDRGLMGDRLALAVELSNRAPGVAATRQLPDAGGPPRPGRGRRTTRYDATPKTVSSSRRPAASISRGRTGPAPSRSPGSCADRRIRWRRQWWTSRDAERLHGEGKPEDAAAMLETLASQRRRGHPGGEPGAEPSPTLCAPVSPPASRPRRVSPSRRRSPPTPRASPARFLSPASTRSRVGPRRPRSSTGPLSPRPPPCPSRTAHFSASSPARATRRGRRRPRAGDRRHRRGNGELLFLRAGLREFAGTPPERSPTTRRSTPARATARCSPTTSRAC